MAGEEAVGGGAHGDFFADGVAVRNGFLTRPQIRGLIDCARRRRERGEFGTARVGADVRARQRPEIRGDSTCWLTAPLFPAEQALLGRLERLRLELNREALLGLFDLELHYAWYPPGAGYARHHDQLHGREQRKVSLVVYLNEEWDTDAGGELRVFGAAEDYRDIEPIGGRLVYFLTEGREHAVLPPQHGRLSLSGWFRQRDPASCGSL